MSGPSPTKTPASPMQRALDQARRAADAGEVPVGAVLVCEGKVIAADHNRMREKGDPTAHAEMLVIQEGLRRLGTQHLANCALYVTLEPCTMCAGALAHVRLKRLYYAAPDPKGGGVDHGACFFDQPTCHHRPEVISGLHETEAAEMLRSFFAARR